MKVWVLLFVCAGIRAVHLELVSTTSTEDFLLAWRRFSARYGMPRIVRPDNAAGFVAASRQLPVVWKFNPPAAPRQGGFYERLVSVVKSPLRCVLGRALLSHDELVTVLAEIQHVVNDRPLTHVADLDDEVPLSPNMLLGETYDSTDADMRSQE